MKISYTKSIKSLKQDTSFTIYNDDLVPVYPYEFGIVSQQNVVLKGSTLNPFAPLHTYLIQIDTTEKFNSPLLTSTSITEKAV